MDYGDDPILSTAYAAEHARAVQMCQPRRHSMLADLRQRHEWNKCTLPELRDKSVTPEMLVACGIKWPYLQSKHGAEAAIQFGFRWPTMLCAGFRGEHLASLSHSQMSALGLNATRMLECRPLAQHLSALRLSAAQLKDMGWTSEMFSAVGVRMHNMVSFGLPLVAWRDTLGVTDFTSFGFTNYAECARAGWCDSDIRLAMAAKPVATTASGAAKPPNMGRIQFI